MNGMRIGRLKNSSVRLFLLEARTIPHGSTQMYNIQFWGPSEWYYKHSLGHLHGNLNAHTRLLSMLLYHFQRIESTLTYLQQKTFLP